VPARAVYVLPDTVPAQRAVLAANLETAVNAVWDARPHVGDRIAVVGAGTVGCLIAWLAGQIGGCVVELVDTNSERASIARSLGVRFASPDMAAADADLVVHASGSPSGLDVALSLAGFESTVVEASWYGDCRVAAPLGAAFHARRLTLKASQVGHIAATQRARWDASRRMTLVMSLLAEPVLDALITGESAFDELPAVMAKLADASPETICHRIKY
jgi:threonine dehydrogenase-like Zn-dependent dehydrogenase